MSMMIKVTARTIKYKRQRHGLVVAFR